MPAGVWRALRCTMQRWLSRAALPAATLCRFSELASLQARHQRTAHAAVVALCRQLRQQAGRQGQDAPLYGPAFANHANGYLRAAALYMMQEQPAAQHIAVIIERLNDWVPQVRLAARIALRAHLQARFFPAWLVLWPQVRQLYHRQREIHRHMVMEVEQFLLAREHQAALCAVLRAPAAASVTPALARECFRLVAHAGLMPLPELIVLALASRDRLIAGCAPAWICALEPAERLPYLLRGLASAQPQVRFACLAQLLRQRQGGAWAAHADRMARHLQTAPQARLRRLSQRWLQAKP